MRGKDLFNTFVRLGGLYLLLHALDALVSILFMSKEMGAVAGSVVGQLFIRSILGGGLLGYFFFAYGHRVANFAFAAEESEDSSAT